MPQHLPAVQGFLSNLSVASELLYGALPEEARQMRGLFGLVMCGMLTLAPASAHAGFFARLFGREAPAEKKAPAAKKVSTKAPASKKAAVAKLEMPAEKAEAPVAQLAPRPTVV